MRRNPNEGDITSTPGHASESSEAKSMAEGQGKIRSAINETLTDETISESVTEAMSKVVDIYSEPDLKYYRPDSPVELAVNLNIGRVTSYNKHIFEEDLSLAENIRRYRQFIAEEESFNQSVNTGECEYSGSVKTEHRKYSHIGNVFYPEGSFKIGATFLRNEDFDEANALSVHAGYTHQILQLFLGVLMTIVDEGKIIDKDIMKGILKIFLKKLPEMKDCGFPIKDYALRSLRKSIDNESEEKARKFFFDNYESIRKKWLETFFEHNISSQYGRMVVCSMDLGCIFDSTARVRSSFNDEYPTQATLLDLNNKKHIVGIFVDELHRGYRLSMQIPEFPEAYNKKERPKNEQGGDFLKQIHFEITPENAPKFFWKYAKLLTNKTNEKILANYPLVATLVSEIESLEQALKTIKGQEWRDLYDKINKRRENLTLEERVEIYEICSKYLTEFTPFKNGQSAWDMIMKLGEHHRLPVYNLKGDLLWPKQMSHEELQEFIAKRDAVETSS